jgi:phosphoserine phosphatase
MSRPTPQAFVDSVLALCPRVAVFDCDSTLWDADSGMEFFYWIIEQGLIPRPICEWAIPRYDDYKAGRVDEKTMCGEMVQICAGLRVETVRDAARLFFREKVEGRLFPEMLQLTNSLREAGCELWAVSSSSQVLIEVEAEPFGFAAENVFAADVERERDTMTDRLTRVPTAAGKADVLRQHGVTRPELGFGNSVHDLAMLEMCGRQFAINPNPDLAGIARQRGWTVYQPTPLRTLAR